jgi:hypothetical protein
LLFLCPFPLIHSKVFLNLFLLLLFF